MKGDFSYLAPDARPRYAGVLQQQGRVLLDRDWNEAEAIAAAWRSAVGRDTFGDTVLAVPVSGVGAFKVLDAASDGAGVKVTLDAGRAWADGLPVALDAASSFAATYFGPPFQSPPAAPSTIAAGVRDLVVLDVWEDSVSGFQDPLALIEPALGGPDTTERVQCFANVKLLRLGPNDDCSAVTRLVDDFDAKGRLTVSPAPVLNITGDCPLEAGGGYTGLEHFLYRIEIADPGTGGVARFKWSQWNGGLVGRGLYAAGPGGTGTVTITANDQMINHCGETEFYLEVLRLDAALGSWVVAMTADATLPQDGQLALSNVAGAWPAPAGTAFFRLWNGIERIVDFPVGGPNPVELKDGIRVEFDAPAAGNANYQPGDFWTFPVRAAGAVFDPPPWPTDAPPQGVRHHRVALGILNWSGPPPVSISFADGEIDDCRRIFRPLTNQKICCTFNVGDGRTSHGDFDAIEEALQHLPASGGEICLLPGLHATNAVIDNRRNVRIKGCDTKTKVVPRAGGAALPIFTVRDSGNVVLEHMDLVTLGGIAIVVTAGKRGGCTEVEIAHNRILACTSAIRARRVRGIHIHDNRIRMLDKRGGDVAIYLAGDDGLIERNDLRLVPAPRMPPIHIPDQPDPVDPNDPCARLEILHVNPRVFVAYVNLVWTLLLPPLVLLTQPYRGQGGIQLGGGSERVVVLENAIVGGAGNGVTLGGTPPPAPPAEPDPTFTLATTARIRARVLGPDGKPRAGVQITLTQQDTGSARSFVTDADGAFTVPATETGTFAVTEGDPGLAIDKIDFQTSPNEPTAQLTLVLKVDEAPPVPETVDPGFLYDITVERNAIEAMGLSGIGTAFATPASRGEAGLAVKASALATAAARLGTPVVGLAIRGNRIEGNLLNPFDGVLRKLAAGQGLGGISLGLCQDLTVLDNTIERNGVSGANPVCGVFVVYAEEAEIARNRIVDNGPLTTELKPEDLIDGRRGGIVLMLTAAFSLLDARTRASGLRFSQRPAARVHENLVDQPVGLALYALAFGPVQCTDNAFSSEMSGPNAVERIAGTVYLYNLGGVNLAGTSTQLRSAIDNQAANATLSRADTAAADAGATLDVNTTATGATGAAGAANAATGSTATLEESARMATPFATFRAAPAAALPVRAAATAQLFPGGGVMFNDNQARTGWSNTSACCHVVATMDDVAWQDNQAHSLRDGPLVTNALVYGNTIRATANRLGERGEATQLSLLTMAMRLNNTSFNQGDHCIVANTASPAMPEVQYGNQIIHPGPLCQSRSQVAGNLLRLLE